MARLHHVLWVAAVRLHRVEEWVKDKVWNLQAEEEVQFNNDNGREKHGDYVTADSEEFYLPLSKQG